MKRIFTTVVLSMIMMSANTQTLRTPQPSPTQTIKQNFGLSTIELSYSRPGMKNRKVFGGIVPYNEVWRTGANNATTLTFSDTVIIGGTKINPGTYGLLSMPREKNWTLIVTKQTNVTSPGAYKMDQDLVRYEAETKELDNSVETFTMQFANLKDGSCDLNIMWDKVGVTLPISINTEGAMLAQINQLMSRDTRPFYNAATYYINNGQDKNKALEWLNMATEQDPRDLRSHYQKANLLVKMGKNADARIAANKGLELAKAQNNQNFVRQFEGLLKDMK